MIGLIINITVISAFSIMIDLKAIFGGLIGIVGLGRGGNREGGS